MYHILGRPLSRAMRVIWLLEEMGENYRLNPAMPHSDDVLQHNPSGKIPVLIDGKLVLTDSMAICRYLTDKHEQFTYPVGDPRRATLDSRLHFLIDDLEQPVWQAAKHSFVLPEEHRLSELKAVSRWEFERAQANFESWLGDGPYIMGEDFTYADIIAAHLGMWARSAKFKWRDGPVTDYFKRTLARPARERAMERGKKS